MRVLTVFIMCIGQQIEADPTARTFFLPVRFARGKVSKDCFRTWMRKLLIKVSDRSLDCFLGFISHFMDKFPGYRKLLYF